MTESELNNLVDAWIAGQGAERGLSEDSDEWWAIDLVMDWVTENDAVSVWNFIFAAYGKPMSDKAFAMLAAGPVEDLLADHGAAYIDRVETLARRDPLFNRLLGGVWRNSISEDVWARIEKVRLTVW